jgi:hypothetical protein
VSRLGGAVVAAEILPAVPAGVAVNQPEAGAGRGCRGGGTQEVPGGERDIAVD